MPITRRTVLGVLATSAAGAAGALVVANDPAASAAESFPTINAASATRALATTDAVLTASPTASAAPNVVTLSSAEQHSYGARVLTLVKTLDDGFLVAPPSPRAPLGDWLDISSPTAAASSLISKVGLDQGAIPIIAALAQKNRLIQQSMALKKISIVASRQEVDRVSATRNSSGTLEVTVSVSHQHLRW